MPQPKLTKLELQILEAPWAHGKASIREIQEAFPEPSSGLHDDADHGIPARREKGGEARPKDRLLDEILSFFGGRAQPMMAQLAEAGKITLDDVRELEKTIEKLELERKAERSKKSK
jgi:BlaI family penicillinase repressor